MINGHLSLPSRRNFLKTYIEPPKPKIMLLIFCFDIVTLDDIDHTCGHGKLTILLRSVTGTIHVELFTLFSHDTLRHFSQRNEHDKLPKL